MSSSAVKAKQKHKDTVFKLLSALLACIDCFFAGWVVEDYGWTDVYLTDISHKCSP